MAGAEDYKKLELERLEVPTKLVKGSKFIKWPKSDGDDTIIAIPVTLRLDPNGYFLHWQEPNRDTEVLDVSSIRDTRIGKYARTPRSERWEKALQCAPDPQIKEVAGNPTIPLEMKCLTVVHGMKFPEPNFLNFIAVEENPHELVKTWADFLLKLAYHPLTWHVCVETAIEKMYTRLRYETNQFGQIPVKKCIKMFGGNFKRVECALTSVGLIKGRKDEMIDPEDFPLIAFKKVLQLTCQRPELDKVFSQLGAKRMSLSLEQLKGFLNNVQRDPRLNEIIYPFLTDEQVKSIIQKYEPNVMLYSRCQLSLEGLEAYLQSSDNLCVSTTKYAHHQDMNHPISHYFINSSHNTYLTGNQYKSKSTAEIYRQCLLAGCRCVELDCWEGAEEPYINHGFTLCSPVSFKDVIEAINESAFKTSQYPVILSFENHVDNPQYQAKMAQYCRDIFGDKLLIDPLESFPLVPNTPLPTPADLLGKIIIKNKKQKVAPYVNKRTQSEDKETKKEEKTDFETPPPTPTSARTPRKSSAASTISEKSSILSEKSPLIPEKTKEKDEVKENGTSEMKKENKESVDCDSESKEFSAQDDTDTESKDKVEEDEDSDDEGSISLVEFDQNAKECGTAMRESRAYEAMSSLVNYVQPVRFKSFEISEKRNRSYEISSFTETAALRLISYYPTAIVNYNKRQMSRIYPKGARMDSSNYNPQLFWNAGCQLVALNFQTLDPAMQLNLGLFEFNGNCGYLLKPEHMRRKDRQFDPFTENIMDGVVAGSLSIKIISGQFLSTSRVSTYVEVDMYGLVADTVRKKYKTSTVNNNGTNPHYDAPPFIFKKVVLPSLATLRIGVMDTNGNSLGQRFLPVEGLRPGYRYITLRNEGNQPLTMPSLFVYIEVKDYIPEKLEMFASILANPIEHVRKQEEEEKEIRGRQNALRRLLDDEEKTRLLNDNPHINELGNDTQKGNPVIVPLPVGDIPPPTNNPTVYVGRSSDDEESPTNSEKTATKKQGLEPLQNYEPAALEVIKKTKIFLKMQKKADEHVTKLLKSQRENYDICYRDYFELPRRSTPLSALMSMLSLTNRRNINVPFEMNMALPPEAKRDQMLMLLKYNFEEEKTFRQRELEDFMKRFEVIVRDYQKGELDELEKITKSEKEDVRNKKNIEKDEKFRKIPTDIPKQEMERRKEDIIEAHVQDSVRDLKMLGSLQEKRLEQVKKDQQEILMMLNEEERNRTDNITKNYNQQLHDVEKIFDIRRVESLRKGKNHTNNVSSMTYPSHDGVNDETRFQFD